MRIGLLCSVHVNEDSYPPLASQVCSYPIAITSIATGHQRHGLVNNDVQGEGDEATVLPSTSSPQY